MQDKKVTQKKAQEYISELDNQSIEFISYRPDGSPFVSIGRKIKITGPFAALELDKLGKDIVPLLIDLLEDSKRDWAANVLLYSILDREEVWTLTMYANKLEEWRENFKDNDLKYWQQLR